MRALIAARPGAHNPPRHTFFRAHEHQAAPAFSPTDTPPECVELQLNRRGDQPPILIRPGAGAKRPHAYFFINAREMSTVV